MATYVFKSASGKVIERERPMLKAPPIGARIMWQGEAYFRVPNMPQAKVSPNLHLTSHSLPRATKQADGSWHSPYSKQVCPETGKPRFTSMKQVREAEARSAHIDGDHKIIYD